MDTVIYKKGVILEITDNIHLHGIKIGTTVRVVKFNEFNKLHIVIGLDNEQPLNMRSIVNAEFKLSRKNKRKY